MIISLQQLKGEFIRILLSHGCNDEEASTCAEIFASNSVDGIYSHGVNRFARFVQYIDDGLVMIHNRPSLRNHFGGLQQWDGNSGGGPLNALFATNKAMEIAKESGIGCVSLANTNHWMRGGYYGWHAAKAGFVFIGFTNTTGVMPAWGAKDPRLGNDPLVIAVPYGDEAIVLDMAMSQYSYGALETASMKNETLPLPGGYDEKGNLSNDPAAIFSSGRPLPIGYWKGSGLALLLDILATLLSGGRSTHEISKDKKETRVSQVYIAIDISRLHNFPLIQSSLQNIINDYHNSVKAETGGDITFPGERVLRTRHKNLSEGIPVEESVWNEIMAL